MPNNLFRAPIVVETWSGQALDLTDPINATITFDDIVIPLARMVRYNGAFPEYYSVAEHSILVADLLIEGAPYHDSDGECIEITKSMVVAALLHDAAEAFIGDLIAPIKVRLLSFGALEHGLMRALSARFGFWPIYRNLTCWSLIERADRAARGHELSYRYARRTTGAIESPRIVGMSAKRAADEFRRRLTVASRSQAEDRAADRAAVRRIEHAALADERAEEALAKEERKLRRVLARSAKLGMTATDGQEKTA